jgi:hypothetical protein
LSGPKCRIARSSAASAAASIIHPVNTHDTRCLHLFACIRRSAFSPLGGINIELSLSHTLACRLPRF